MAMVCQIQAIHSRQYSAEPDLSKQSEAIWATNGPHDRLNVSASLSGFMIC